MDIIKMNKTTKTLLDPMLTSCKTHLVQIKLFRDCLIGKMECLQL